MNHMLCSNTASLNKHELDQEARDKLLADNQQYIQDRAYDILCVAFAGATDEAMEALHGEGFTSGDYFVMGSLMSCAKNAKTDAEKDIHKAALGEYVMNKIEDYLRDASIEQAEKEVLEQ